MFTGIVEKTAQVLSVEKSATELQLTVAAAFPDAVTGESVAVNGVCLTVTEHQNGQITFFVSDETLRRTNLGDLCIGDLVNLERSMLANARLSGHWVQGHVDGMAELMSVSEVGEARQTQFRIDAALGRYCVEKGSIALDGVSLTLNSVSPCDDGGVALVVMLIPYTWEHTRFYTLLPGARLNVETDIIAKYVEKLCQPFPRP